MLLKAVDLVLTDVTPLAVVPWTVAGALLLLGRDRAVVWAVLLGSAVGVCVDARVELTWQHTVLLAFVALAALVARDATERLLLWRVQVSVLYGVAALAKVNESFLGGGVLAVSLRDGPLGAFPGPSLLVAMSVAVVASEAALAVSPWVARLRRPALLLGVLLHGGALVLLPPAPLVGLRLVFFGGLGVVLLAGSAGVVRVRG